MSGFIAKPCLVVNSIEFLCSYGYLASLELQHGTNNAAL